MATYMIFVREGEIVDPEAMKANWGLPVPQGAIGSVCAIHQTEQP